MNLLTIKNLEYAFDSKRKIFDNLNLSIEQNSIVRLFGDNGSGKTTFLKIISNIIDDKNLTYEASFLEKNIKFSEIRNSRVFVPDSPVFYEELTMKQNIKFYKLLFKYSEEFIEKVYSLCEKLNILKFLEEPVKELSLGTRQKLFLSINLSIPCELVLLDEPFNSLDSSSRKSLAEIINNSNNKTFIIVSHENEEYVNFSHELNSSNWSLNILERKCMA